MRRASCLLLATTLAFTVITSAAADALAKLHEALLPLRAPAIREFDVPGFWTYNTSGDYLRYAVPAVTPVKRLLRDWIETQLITAPENVRERSFAARLNAALRGADSFCRQTAAVTAPDRCESEERDWNSMGFVHPEIKVDRPAPSVLVIRAGLGIECGTDTSAYAYEWRDDHWQRFWQYEQPIEKGVTYHPQWIDVVSVSESDANGARLVLTLGNMDWCSSTFYPVYVRLWRAAPDRTAPKLLLDLEEPAWLNAGDDLTPPITGRVTLTDAHIEFMRDDRITLENHEAVLHFEIRGETLERVDPLARAPAAFVLEWLHAPWPESRGWIAARDAARFEPWYRKLNSGRFYTEYPTTNACRDDASLWQVTLDMAARSSGVGFGAYFIVARTSPDRFEIQDVRTTPRAGCNGP